MTAYGYLAFLIRVSPPSRTRNLQRLNEVGPDRSDLLAGFRTQLTELGETFHRNDSLAEGFRLNAHQSHGRSEFIRLRRGPVGSPGETYDIETDQATETTANIALLGELRAAIFIPEDSYYGLLFVERIGGRHLKDLIYRHLVVPLAKQLRMVIRLEAFAETDDWKKELAGQQVLRVTEVLKRKDTAADASTVDDLTVRVAAEGTPLARLSDNIKDRIYDVLNRTHLQYRLLAQIAPFESRKNIWADVRKNGETVKGFKKAPKSLFTVSDADELNALLLELESLNAGSVDRGLVGELQEVLPIDRAGYLSQRLEVALGQERAEKTFVIEADKLPQLIYPLGGRLLDIDLQRVWESHAEQFFGGLGINTPAGWLLEKTETVDVK